MSEKSSQLETPAQLDLESGPESASRAAEDGKPVQQENDPNIIDWDGPDDPEKPMNWPKYRKAGIIATVCMLRFVTPLASSMMAAGLVQIEEDFKNAGVMFITFSVSIYIIGFGLGPLALAPLSEVYGRNIIYHIGNIMFTGFTVGCGASPNAGSLFTFRLLSGIVGGVPLTNAGGTISDIVPVNRRGSIMTLFTLCMLVGPVIGPTVGGFLSEAAGWRWIFWLLTIMSGLATLFGLAFLRETYGPVLLERKAARLRKETGNPLLRGKGKIDLPYRQLLFRNLSRPTRMLIYSPVILGVSLYMALVYGVIYLLFTTFSVVFQKTYGFSEGIAGLSYLGTGVGMVIALFSMGWYSDAIHIRLTKKYGTELPEYRLAPLLPGTIALPIGLFIYGWTAQYKVHWIVPIIGTAFVGIATTGSFNTIQIYLVDAYTVHAASALAANSLVRSLAGGLVPLGGPSLYSNLGLGWGNSLLAFLAIFFAIFPLLFYKFGERWRKRYSVSF
ncbi:MFS general substrate transporter [Xylona heveae TC161]|uniref:MFS general substrate transporter n=1 Tax=Xylona heveae (strain CBS 132557 / TC161) TaxID=1328760 RepID=A0A165FH11_XYLHT|nr:MFS general substrate transporter [Xylona heveae TC161]KZF20970.1 MFS general substrate transporter [Xylona heveae TC161]